MQVFAAGETIDNYHRNTNEANFTAVFQVTLPPVGFNTYQIQQTSTVATTTTVSAVSTPAHDQDIVLENENLVIVFSQTTGRLTAIKNKASGVQTNIDQYFCSYMSNQGDSESGQASGAYIFRPVKDTACTPVATGPVAISVITGPLVQEVRQVFSDWVTQTVRLTKGASHAEFHYTVGPIDIVRTDVNKVWIG